MDSDEIYNNKVMICFTWNKPGDNVFVTGPFNKFSLLKLECEENL